MRRLLFRRGSRERDHTQDSPFPTAARATRLRAAQPIAHVSVGVSASRNESASNVPTPLDATPLSFAHLSELEVGPPELIDLAARAGFASVGIRTNAAMPGGIEYNLRSPSALAQTRRRMADTGVSVLYVEMISLSRDTRIGQLEPMFETGAALGATRLAIGGNDPDFVALAERLAELCDLASGYGIAIDLEFMPFRPVKSLADALEVVTRAQRPNAHILVDALHFFRSGSDVAMLKSIDPALLGTFQLCDAPRQAPAPEDLVTEARTRRLLPGAGGLPLWSLIDALPATIPFGVELPIASQYPALSPDARAALMVRSTREFLRARPEARAV